MSKDKICDECLRYSEDDEHVMKQIVVQQACRCGPSVARVVDNIWAVSILEADRNARKLIRLSKRYTVKRLEAACQRAIYYRQDKNGSTISWILEKGYDQLPLSPYADIRGQLLFSFAPLDLGETEDEYEENEIA